MLYKREGLPETDEIVLCKVTKIFPNSVFAELVEYRDSGMIHISEVSPGRIRNLRDYVSVGRQIVCKVLRIDRERGHIDLSLRRVNSNQRRQKLEEVKQEIKSEGLISNLAKRLDIPFRELYQKISKKVFEEYSHLHLCFKDVVSGDVDLVKLGLEKKIAEGLTTAIKDKFKPPKIRISGEIRLETYTSEGLEKIKKTLGEIQKISKKIDLFYLGAGRYKFSVEEADYKPAEKKFKQAQKIVDKFNDKISKAEFIRE